MKRDAIEKIVDLSDKEVLEVGDFKYIKDGYEKVNLPNVNTLLVRTLRGFVEFVKDFKVPENEELMILVNDHHSADLVGKIDPIYKNRQIYCSSKININMPIFNEWRRAEDFNIFIQVFFNDKGDKKIVLDTMSRVTNEASEITSDDGTKQDVTLRKGVTLRDNAVVPNPCSLAPKRTFPEIDQPESKFVLRVDKQACIKLFEADGGHYKLDAIQGIKDYIKENLGDNIKIPIIG